jgi:CRP-like cAMP-binding protein
MSRRGSYPDLIPPRAPSGWTPARVEVFLRLRTELFRRAPGSARVLARSATVRRLPAGTALCAGGEPALELWVLLEGRVSVNRPLAGGGAHSLEIMLPGEAFGLPALASWRYPSAIEADRDSVVAALPRPAVLRELEASAELSRAAFALLSRRLAFLEAQVSLARRPVSARLAAALAYLAHKFGRSVPLTRAEVGALAGTTPETTIRTLARFSREGLVRLRAGGLDVCDAAALRARAFES